MRRAAPENGPDATSALSELAPDDDLLRWHADAKRCRADPETDWRMWGLTFAARTEWLIEEMERVLHEFREPS